MSQPQPPQNWHRRPVKMTLLALFSAICGLTFLVMAYSEGIRAHRLAEAAALIGWASLSLTGATVMVLIYGGFVESRVEQADDAVVLRPALILDLLGRFALIVMAVAGIVGIGAWWHGELHVSDSLFDHRQETRFIYASALMAAVGFWTCPRWFSRRGVVGYFRLDARGLEYRQGRRTIEIAWDAITAITDVAVRGKGQPYPITFTCSDGEALTYAANSFGRDAALVYWALRFYWLNPHRRSEFDTAAAAERLLARDVKPLVPAR